MKNFIVTILLGCLCQFGYAQKMDSVKWDKAEHAMHMEQYQEACSLYVDLYKDVVKDYKKINSKDVEDLRKTYSIDELDLKNNIQNNLLLQFIWIGSFVLVAMIIGFIFYLRYQNKRIVRSEQDLANARKIAEESIRNKSLMLSNMSHEIRTPLNALSGFSEILSMEGIDEETRKQSNDVIQLNSELLLKLINDIISISCLDISNMTFDVRSYDVVSISQSVVKTISAIKQTEAEILLDTDLKECLIETDSSRLQQLLINLIVNATKFTKQGSIVLKLEKPEDHFVLFSVTDTGCGIPLEKQATIFGRFEKLNENVQGTGLGLSICQLIIQRFGGRIWIDSSYMDGCRFMFTHPISQKEVKE